MAIAIVGYLSGGHINRVVTIAMALVDHISPILIVMYIVVQCIDSAAGACVLKLRQGIPQ